MESETYKISIPRLQSLGLTFAGRRMKKLHYFLAVGVVVASLTGCGLEHPAYSENVQYELRTDPIVRAGQEAKLGDDGFVPDRPGVFPLMKFDDIFKQENPIYPKSSIINDSILRDPTKI